MFAALPGSGCSVKPLGRLTVGFESHEPLPCSGPADKRHDAVHRLLERVGIQHIARHNLGAAGNSAAKEFRRRAR